MPREEIDPGETLESYFGQTKRKTLDTRPLNKFILDNYGLGENKHPHQQSTKPSADIKSPSPNDILPNPFQEIEKLRQKIEKINKLSICNTLFQEEIHRLLEFTDQERKDARKTFREKAHFPLRFTPNLKSKSKWQVRWHPKAAPLVKYAYQIFHGSTDPTNPLFHPKLREILQLSGRCLVCRLTNKEWKHPEGILVAGRQPGRCSAKVASPLVPQSATNVAETYSSTTDIIKFLRRLPQATIPKKATEGSTAYDLYPSEEATVPPHSRKLVSTGLSCEFPLTLYGQIASRSGLSLKHSIDIATSVLDSDYRGTINVLLHNHSDQPYQLRPTQAMAQILFIPLSQLPLKEASQLSNTDRGAKGFGSSNVKTFSSEVIQLKPVTGRPPGTTFLGAQPSKATIRLNSIDGPGASIIINSGSNITLVSSKMLSKLDPAPSPKEGQHIKINQVTGRSSTTQYVPLDIYFETDAKLISIRLEVYIVKDMNAPLILGNDFADQYSLSILRENGNTCLKLGDSGYHIPLDNSVESSYLDVQALQVRAQAIQHQKNN